MNKFTRSQFPLIDGVVIPNGPAPISSTAIVIETPATDGQSWDYIQAGKVLSQDTAEVDGLDYASPGHTMIALHANKAITFDLAAIRQALPQFETVRFQAVAAYGGLGAGASADFAVYIDGSPRAEGRGINHATGGKRLDLPLGKEARFLTLVATDGGNGIAYDQIFFGDPRLVIDPPAEAATAGTAPAPDPTVRAALLERRGELERQISAATRDEKVYAVVSEQPSATHLLKRGDPESPGDEVSPGALSVVATLSPDLAAADAPEHGAVPPWPAG